VVVTSIRRSPGRELGLDWRSVNRTGWFLVGGDADGDESAGMRITDDLYLGVSDLLRRLLNRPPPRALLVGYSGWGPGQLEQGFKVRPGC
jgi:putative AlgH/UPF0301 family transcriptional regulator